METDLCIIGGGPGGYVAAIRAAQLGFKTTVIEKRGALGGTCLNEGCIPSKALLHSSHMFEAATTEFPHHGVDVEGVRVSIDRMMEQKQSSIDSLNSGIEYLFKKNGIRYIKGTGKFVSPSHIAVTAMDGSGDTIVHADRTIIATGSDANRLPGIPVDERVICTNRGALSLERIPRRMLVVGAGVIGLELGSVWRRLGSDVTVVEYGNRITPGMDSQLSKQLQRSLKKQGMDFKLNMKLASATINGDVASCVLEGVKTGKTEERDFDCVLLAIGRHAFTEGLNADGIGVTMDRWGRIDVDSEYQSSVPNVYAIGDVVEGAMLAHKAEEEGVVCVERLAGLDTHVNYDAIPSVIYTAPEFAGVGQTEEDLKQLGRAYLKGTFALSGNSRAKAVGETEGTIKVLADKETERIVGVHMLSVNASEAIAEGGLMVHQKMPLESIIECCHAHPTFSEAVREAAMDCFDRSIHK